MRAAENSDEVLTIRRPRPVEPTRSTRLLVEVDGKKVSEYQLDREQPIVNIGRSVMNDVVVRSQAVSRMHARLRFNSGTWLIEDTESLNGLLYQGNRIEQLPLTNGDRVQLAPKVAVLYVSA
jgi:pSer/pThr/pTyr-binding forkhead associated (FHA) protein